MKINKFILFVGLFLSSCFYTMATEKKTNSDTAAFNKIVQLVKSKKFCIYVDHAFPTGRSITLDTRKGEKTIGGPKVIPLTTNRGEVFLYDSVATGILPFFGEAYTAPTYGEGARIEFQNAKMKKENLKVIQKKKKQYISFDFTLRQRGNIFTFNMEAYANGECHLTVRTNKHSAISYSGTLSILPESERN